MKKDILIVDDSLEQREMLQHMLKKQGHNLWLAQSGREAQAILSQKKMDLVISDLQMPEGDGHGLLKFARQNNVPNPIIILSADPSVQEKDLISQGAKAFLVKPFTLEDLMSLVDNLLK